MVMVTGDLAQRGYFHLHCLSYFSHLTIESSEDMVTVTCHVSLVTQMLRQETWNTMSISILVLTKS